MVLVDANVLLDVLTDDPDWQFRENDDRHHGCLVFEILSYCTTPRRLWEFVRG
jgi:hypothetical protein